ncbi:MAG: M61 family metallopeptidase [Gemmatimonadaceae bacterium]|nr:M61 family metallopeptidase [Gemmatimonadaceae bacterium]
MTGLRFVVSVGPQQVSDGLLELRAEFAVQGTGPVLLSMPAWTPGAYEIANHARSVMGFAATQAGRPLRWDKLDPDTWRVWPQRSGRVELRYRVRAERLDVAGSWLTEGFGFFNGTNLFLEVEGRPHTPALVAIDVPSDWRVTTGMTPHDSTNVFRAEDVHDLMDHPVFVGRFDLDSALVGERWMRLATWPEGSLAGARRAALWDAAMRSVEPMVAVFGDLPWRSYTILQVAHPDVPGMSALEHSESELALVGSSFLDEPFVLSIHAHEIVHAWNVKRLRPSELVPYRYDRAQPTPWLWVSEGITDYYADLALLRGGIRDESAFLSATLDKIESVTARPPTALEDASLQAWIGIEDGTGDLYYDKGSLAGLALDILIRDASANERSLDHVVRELYDGTYRAGRGFTHDDFWNAVARATRGRAWGDFERRYLDGRDTYPWADWLQRGGWRLVEDSIAEPRLGVLLREHPDGVLVSAVDPEGAGARAGLQIGDVITELGGRSVLDPGFGDYWRGVWGRRPGAMLPIRATRAGQSLVLSATVELQPRVERRIEPDPNADAKARRIRAGILAGTPRP